jgi:hypothetical protein
VGGELSLNGAHDAARAQAEPAVKAVEAKPTLTPAQISKIAERVRALQERSGFTGDYASYIQSVTPEHNEA